MRFIKRNLFYKRNVYTDAFGWVLRIFSLTAQAFNLTLQLG